MATNTVAQGKTTSSAIWLVPALCGFAVGFDGYDLIVYGTVAIAGVIAALIIFLLPRSPISAERAEWM
ncbi:MAG TPA: hypothetical protein VIZ60_16360 [Rubrobacter sp.]